MMSRLLGFRRARWSASSESFDEEKHASRHIPMIVITPPPSPNPVAAETSWSISGANPSYLQPPQYLHFLHDDHFRESRRRSLERPQQEGSWWWTLSAVFLLLLISSSLRGIHSIHTSEARDRDELNAGLALQEHNEGARVPDPVDGASPILSFHFELPQFPE